MYDCVWENSCECVWERENCLRVSEIMCECVGKCACKGVRVSLGENMWEWIFMRVYVIYQNVILQWWSQKLKNIINKSLRDKKEKEKNSGFTIILCQWETSGFHSSSGMRDQHRIIRESISKTRRTTEPQRLRLSIWENSQIDNFLKEL